MSKYFKPGENPEYDRQVEKEAEATKALYEQAVARHARQVEELELRKQLRAEEEALEQLRQTLERKLQKERERVAKLEQKHKKELAEQRKKISELRTRLLPASEKKREREHVILCRKEAEASGAKTYLTGLPCRNGHVAPRYVSSGACAACDAMYASPGYTKRRQPKQAT